MRDFSVEIGPDVGFTDQLNQFFILYTLATQLGLRYLPEKIVTRRNIGSMWADLALSEHLCQPTCVSNNARRPKVAVHVKDKRNGVRYSHVSEVLADLHAVISEQSPEDVLVFRIAGNRNVLMRLLRQLPPTAFEHFRQTFDTALAKSGFPSPFTSSSRLRVLFHIRKGDTARIETPWEGPLAFWHDQAAIAVSQRPDDVVILRAVARKLSAVFGPDQVEMVVFSDGYARTASLLATTLSNSIVFSNERQDFIRAILAEKEAELELFATLPRTKLFLGEGHDEFKRLLFGLREADVIITNGAQRLPSKVLGALPTRAMKQRLIVVGADISGDHYHTDCILNRENCEYIPVAWNSFSLQPILDACHDALDAHGISQQNPQDPYDDTRALRKYPPECRAAEHYNKELLRLLRNASNISQALGRLNEALADVAILKRAMPADHSLDEQQSSILDWIAWLECKQA